jgi:hypothetical protein
VPLYQVNAPKPDENDFFVGAYLEGEFTVDDEDLDLDIDEAIEDAEYDLNDAQNDLANAEDFADEASWTEEAEEAEEWVAEAQSAVETAQAKLDGLRARKHGRGGPTSEAAKGRGRNPAQDTLGRFSAGRPGSQRDASTGRFA